MPETPCPQSRPRRPALRRCGEARVGLDEAIAFPAGATRRHHRSLQPSGTFLLLMIILRFGRTTIGPPDFNELIGRAAPSLRFGGKPAAAGLPRVIGDVDGFDLRVIQKGV